jgi:hypothetical protein
MQPKFKFSLVAFAVVLAAGASGACNREGEEPKVAEVQTQTPPQAVNQPATVSGCLRAGEASDTFVLMATRTQDREEPATYELVGSGGVNLRDHVGKRVEASGVISSQQQATGRALDTTADRAKGTSGTPSVSTRTEVDVKRLEVQSIRPLGESCATEDK